MKYIIKHKFIKDVFWNFLSSIIPLIALQLIFLPLIARKVNPDANGLILTIISLITMISTSLGNVLNNIRLLFDIDYKEKQQEGDFNLLVIIACAINAVIILWGSWYYYGAFNIVNISFVVLISILELVKEYFVVTFAIAINFKKDFISNIFLVIGYGIGTVLFCLFGYWQFIYLFGILFKLIFILANTKLYKEKLHKTVLFKKTVNKSVVLLISVFLGKAMQYIDKLILFPLIGGAAVAVYYVATLIGKLVSMAITPINAVMLSYLTKMKKFKQSVFLTMLFASALVGAVGYIICIFISRPVFNIIYPQYANDAMKYIYITTFTAVVVAISTFISPVILKFCNMNWQIVINLLSFIIYIISTILLFNGFGLTGFCWGTLIAGLTKLLLMIVIYLQKNGNVKE